ncbi:MULTISPECIES: amino acid ABC transporter substrate-binding protein [unclassified Archaeoglobus]|jgi:branched-chain amino acid transport system substrate-binding protein|uniref:amino acid ABC transporter substrate-binding protein n=1 Tax=unclassified Archaeoglobus TaxID=2643606 RepID=UPI0025BEC2F5|nr:MULTISPECIES: amino acid ABC transporter substrate-binding protein [unclassified Archaeoglobus]
MRKKVFVLVLVGFVLFFAGCAQQPEEKPTTTTPAATPTGPKEETLYFGAPISLSGKFAKEGQMSLWGMQVAAQWINENGGIKVGNKVYKVEIKYYDDESKKESVQSLIERLATVDKVKFILAPYSSGLTMAAAPIAEKYGVLMNSHGGASDYIFEQGYYYVVQTLSPASKYQTGFLDMVKTLDPDAKRLALVYEDKEFSRAVHQAAKEYAEKLGFEIVYEKTYPAGTTDLSPILNELKAANPDVLIGGGHFADGQLLAQQLAELNINIKAISILVAPSLPAFYEALGTKAEGISAPAQWETGVKYSPEVAEKLGVEWYGPTQEEFIKMFKDLAGEDAEPSYHVAEAAAAVLSYAKAIEKAQSTDVDRVREAMNDLEFMCVYGMWSIDPETGKQVGHDMVIIQWQNEEKKIVWPESAANAKPCYPMPTWDEKAEGKTCGS